MVGVDIKSTKSILHIRRQGLNLLSGLKKGKVGNARGKAGCAIGNNMSEFTFNG